MLKDLMSRYIAEERDNLHHPYLPAAHHHQLQQRTEGTARKITRERYPPSRLCFCVRREPEIKPNTLVQKDRNL